MAPESTTKKETHAERVDHQAGDLVLIPNGWSGVWEIHGHFKKQYVTIAA